MLEAGQNWKLFGYDMRQLGGHWLAAWRSLVWDDDSPLRKRLDEVVCLRGDGDPVLYQAGKVSAQASFECEAVLLPDALALSKSLRLPAAAEGDLGAVLALEVNANSPFSADDTAYGWQLVTRDEALLQLVLVIVSKSAVMAYLGRQYDIHDAHALEIWAAADGAMVVLRGFGEHKREARYRKRLRRCGVMLVVSAVFILLIAGVAAGAMRAELLQVEALADSARSDAVQASRMRTSLALANETIDAANRIVGLYPNPHYEIARLTRLLDDDAHIVQFAMSGREIRLRGRAADASAVMQKLTDEPAYAEVTAPQAIVKVGNTGLEQFSLNINLNDGPSG
ncbi:MAG: general secretion pathway protein GspL [Gammaproteobacteria bacterium]|nr:MAG: general secretion pathway protein GspL [Gammaproteobacteria bacterium]RLA61216.1 MAG: general secretion pathway protein GspL [Gammaproteobacteria bacterium]